MRKIVLILFACICLYSGVPSFANEQRVNLKQAYESVLRQHPDLMLGQSQIDQRRQDVKIAKGAIALKADLLGSYVRRAKDTSPFSKSDRTDFSTSRIQVTQPLFQGFKELAAIHAIKSQLAADEYKLEQIKIDLYTALLHSFYTILSLETEKRNLQELWALTQKRVRELNERTKIGRSAMSELLWARSQLSRAGAQIGSMQTQINTEREHFAYLTQLPRNVTLQATNRDHENIKEIDFYLNALLNQPQLKAVKKEVSVAENEIKIAKGDHYPSLDVEGNYYLKQSEGSFRDVDWDVSLNLTFPLFRGGVIRSTVRKTEFALRERKQRLLKIERELITSTRKLYQMATGGIKNMNAFQEATRLAKRSYEEQIKDYQSGLISNLEVFQSLNQYIESKNDLEKQGLENQLHYALLIASIGMLP